jgi:hypothetical protein
MDLGKFMGRAQRFLLDNSPAILTAVGITGALTTAYLTGKATFKAADTIIHRNQYREEDDMPLLTKKEAIALTWQHYIPAAGSAVVTVVAILCANKVGSKRAAALASAYAISERAFETYKEKVIEKLGETKERAIRDEIAQDDVVKNPPTQIILTGGNVLFRDGFSGRDFRSTMEEIRKAANDINHQVNNDFTATLSDFYELLNLDPTDKSDEFGWHADKLLDIRFSSTITKSGEPCIVFNYDVSPIRGYHRIS